VARHNVAWILPKTMFFGRMPTLTFVNSQSSFALKTFADPAAFPAPCAAERRRTFPARDDETPF
ncbi:hypothetical protein, partial [uncultured Bilophila sp.]